MKWLKNHTRSHILRRINNQLFIRLSHNYNCPCVESIHKERIDSEQVEKIPVTFTYEGELSFSVDGECTVQMTERDIML